MSGSDATGSPLMPCREVGVESLCEIEPYTVVEAGGSAGECSIVYARPSPCIVTPFYTLVRRVRRARLEVVELKRNVVVRLQGGDGVSAYVYPKSVWERVSAYIEALSRGRAPPEPGLLLYGPPGTGKTSMARLLADALGVHVVELDQSILSKWVGESEANLRARLDEAEENEPALVIADEGEWLLARRELSGGSVYPSLLNNLVNELLRRLQRWKNEGVAVAMIVATNYSIKAIDQAFLRPGRFGEPVLVPPPDLEAIVAMLREMGVEEVLGREGVERLARRLLAVGANMAEVVKVARAVKKGEKPRLSPMRSYGYRRLMPIEVPSERELDELAKLIKCTLCVDNRPSSQGRYALTGVGLYTGIALLSLWFLRHGYAPILVYSPERIEEAIHMAESSKSALIMTPTALQAGVEKVIMDAQAPVALIATGTLKHGIPFATLEVSTRGIKHASSIGRAVELFYGIRVKTGAYADLGKLEEMIAARLAAATG